MPCRWTASTRRQSALLLDSEHPSPECIMLEVEPLCPPTLVENEFSHQNLRELYAGSKFSCRICEHSTWKSNFTSESATALRRKQVYFHNFREPQAEMKFEIRICESSTQEASCCLELRELYAEINFHVRISAGSTQEACFCSAFARALRRN